MFSYLATTQKTQREPANGQVAVLLLANAIHTDIALPARPEVLNAFGFLGDAGLPIGDPAVRWIIIGWGGRSFYLETPNWSDLKPLPVLRALTLDRSVMHVTLGGDIDPSGPGVRTLLLNNVSFDALLKASLERFSTNGEHRPIEIENAAYSQFDRFYEAAGFFNALVGCNTWTAAVLRSAGFRTGWWNPLPFSLGASLSLWNECDPNGGTCYGSP